MNSIAARSNARFFNVTGTALGENAWAYAISSRICQRLRTGKYTKYKGGTKDARHLATSSRWTRAGHGNFQQEHQLQFVAINERREDLSMELI